MQQVTFPFEQFLDTSGNPLDNGYVYVGTANQNPETNPIAIYWDAALTIPAAQPIRTINGYLSNSGTPARLYTSPSIFSITVRDKTQAIVASALDAQRLVGRGLAHVAVDQQHAPVHGRQGMVGGQRLGRDPRRHAAVPVPDGSTHQPEGPALGGGRPHRVPGEGPQEADRNGADALPLGPEPRRSGSPPRAPSSRRSCRRP